MIEALHATGPIPEHDAKMMLFGQFVGSWEFDWIGYDERGKTRTARGEWHFSWVLEGRAVQDVWIAPARSLRAETGPDKGEYGTTIRFYEPASDTWRVVWVGPVYGNVRVFTAREIGEEIVIEGTNCEGKPLRWIFSQITPNDFHWRSRLERDPGAWVTLEEMDVRRLGETALSPMAQADSNEPARGFTASHGGV